MAGKDFELGFSVDPADLVSGLNRASSEIASFTAKTTDSIAGLSGNVTQAFGSIKNALTGAFAIGGIGAAVAGIATLVGSITQLGEEAEQIRDLASVVGLTSAQFQGLGVAAARVGLSEEQAERGTERLAQELEKARAGSAEAQGQLQDMGISLEQIQDPGFTTAQLLATIGDNLNNTNTAARTHDALIAALGPRYGLLSNALKDLQGELGGFKGAAAEVNALSEAQVNTLASLAERWKSWKEGVHNAIAGVIADLAGAGGGNLGALQTQLEMYQKIAKQQGPQAGKYAEEQVAAITKQIDALTGVAAAQQSIAATAATLDTKQADATDELTEKQKESVITGLRFQIDAAKEGSEQRLALTAQLYSQLSTFYTADSDKAKAAYEEVERTVLSVNARIEEDTKRSAEQRFRAMEEAERSWVTSEHAAVDQILRDADAYFEALKRQDEQLKAVAESSRNSALAQIQSQLDALQATNTSKSGGGNSQLLAQQETLIAEEITAWHTYYDQLRQLAQGNVTALSSIDAEELAKTKDLTQQTTKLQQQSAEESLQAWNKVFKPLTAQIGDFAKGVLTGTETVREAFKKMTASIIENLIQMGAERGAQHLLVLAYNALEQRSNAAAAAAGAAKSAADIPFIGYLLAPLAAATTYGAATAYSAAEGFDVPAGLSPTTQLHPREMVLPAELADIVRGGGAGGGTTNHFHISAIDASGFDKLMSKPGFRDSVARATRNSFRGGGHNINPGHPIGRP